MKHKYIVRQTENPIGTSYKIAYHRNGAFIKEVEYHNVEYALMILEEFVRWKPQSVIKYSTNGVVNRGELISLERAINEFRERKLIGVRK